MSLHTYKHSGAYASRAPRRVSRERFGDRRRLPGRAWTLARRPASPRASRSTKNPKRENTHGRELKVAHAGVGIKGVADKNPTAAVMTVGDKSTSVKGIFQQQAKTVANLCAAARPDLTVRRKRRRRS